MSGIRILAAVASVFFVAIVVMTGCQVSRNVKRQQKTVRADGTVKARRQRGSACYLLFALSDGTEREFKADKALFDGVAEGDAGMLTFRGRILLGFERRAEQI